MEVPEATVNVPAKALSMMISSTYLRLAHAKWQRGQKFLGAK